MYSKLNIIYDTRTVKDCSTDNRIYVGNRCSRRRADERMK